MYVNAITRCILGVAISTSTRDEPSDKLLLDRNKHFWSSKQTTWDMATYRSGTWWGRWRSTGNISPSSKRHLSRRPCSASTKLFQHPTTTKSKIAIWLIFCSTEKMKNCEVIFRGSEHQMEVTDQHTNKLEQTEKKTGRDVIATHKRGFGSNLNWTLMDSREQQFLDGYDGKIRNVTWVSSALQSWESRVCMTLLSSLADSVFAACLRYPLLAVFLRSTWSTCGLVVSEVKVVHWYLRRLDYEKW